MKTKFTIYQILDVEVLCAGDYGSDYKSIERTSSILHFIKSFDTEKEIEFFLNDSENEYLGKVTVLKEYSF